MTFTGSVTVNQIVNETGSKITFPSATSRGAIFCYMCLHYWHRRTRRVGCCSHPSRERNLFFFGGGGEGKTDYRDIKSSAVISYLARLSFMHKDKSTFLHHGPGTPSDWLSASHIQ